MCDHAGGNKDTFYFSHRQPQKVAVVGEGTTDKPLLTQQPTSH